MRRMPLPLLALCALLAAAVSHASTLDRDRDPVVLTGSDLPSLLGLSPSTVVAFRYQGGWVQIPEQIDERDTVTFNQVYGGGWPQLEIDVETYTDSGTYVGADSDPLFDGDDELVFMAKDAGGAAPGGASPPTGAVAGSGVELAIRDSLDGGRGFVYLLQGDGSLAPDAGTDYVTYTFDLLAGSYPDDYNLMIRAWTLCQCPTVAPRRADFASPDGVGCVVAASPRPCRWIQEKVTLSG
jgi:hypothetical protein